jgi:hypothetical protein
MNHIDRIFSDALGEHTSTPSAGLWERVEPALPVDARSASWLRWAAIWIPILFAAGFWLTSPQPEMKSSVALQVTTPVSTPAVAEPASPAQHEPLAFQPTTRKSTRAAGRNKNTQPVTIEATTLPEVASMEEIAIEPLTLEEETIAIVDEPVKPMTLVYTLDEVALAPDEGTKKESALNRVVEFAQAVKHSDPIGDIRGFKDELLALDLRKKPSKKN